MFDTFLQLLFPEYCAGCKNPGTALCGACLTGIPPAHTIYSMENATAFYDYAHPIVRRAVWELKYYRKSPTARILAQSGQLPGIETQRPVVLVPVPQHYTKTLSRGFNQSVSIAKWMQPLIPSATIARVLKKVRATEAQAQTDSKEARGSNLRESMTVRKGRVLDPETLYVIIDDVITTGSTAAETSRALRAAGAVHIRVVALAHGHAR